MFPNLQLHGRAVSKKRTDGFLTTMAHCAGRVSLELYSLRTALTRSQSLLGPGEEQITHQFLFRCRVLLCVVLCLLRCLVRLPSLVAWFTKLRPSPWSLKIRLYTSSSNHTIDLCYCCSCTKRVDDLGPSFEGSWKETLHMVSTGLPFFCSGSGYTTRMTTTPCTHPLPWLPRPCPCLSCDATNDGCRPMYGGLVHLP